MPTFCRRNSTSVSGIALWVGLIVNAVGLSLVGGLAIVKAQAAVGAAIVGSALHRLPGKATGHSVDIAIHAQDHESDERNYHAHLMVTMRQLGPEGFAGNKDRSLNTSAQLGEWREEWADLANRHLERQGHAERIDRWLNRPLKKSVLECFEGAQL